MALIRMKTESDDMRCCAPDNEYGYGLRISLTEEQVEALGLKANPPGAGTQVGIQAVATVMRVSQEVSGDGDKDGVDVCLSLQITDMSVTPSGVRTQAASADLLYGTPAT